MFTAAVALLPALALAAPINDEVPVVEDATADLQGERLAVEITTTLPVFREDVRAKIDGRNVVVYVGGAALPAGKRLFGEGAIKAYPRATYAKLEIPMPAGLTCGGPATISIDDGLIHVGMACGAGGLIAGTRGERGSKPASAAADAGKLEAEPGDKLISGTAYGASVAAAKAARAEKAAAGTVDNGGDKTGDKAGEKPGETWAAKPVARAAASAEAPSAEPAHAEAPSPTPAPLRGLLRERTAAAPKERSLPASTGTMVAPEAAPAPAARVKPAEPPAPVLAAAPAATPAATAEPVLSMPSKPEPEPLAIPGPRPAADKRAVADISAARPTESTSPVVIGGGLLLLAVAGFLLYRKRREHHAGHIRILETASLGPKRALVVAEIDGEKMILGTSEAGISVLTPMSRMVSPWGEQTGATRVQLPMAFTAEVTSSTRMPAAMMTTATAAAMAAAPAAPAHEPVREVDDNEGGLLSRLFRRSPPPDQDVDLEGLGNMEDEFRDLLADSLEDEELRRRLQAGIGGRTA